MRRAWRRDIKERKKQRKHRRSTVVQTPTDPRTAGNNDKVWEQVTEDENLQQLLYEILTTHTGMPEHGEQARLEEWLENNIQGCAAVTYPGRMYMANGDPGYPDEYCENPVAPGRGEYCEFHEEE